MAIRPGANKIKSKDYFNYKQEYMKSSEYLNQQKGFLKNNKYTFLISGALMLVVFSILNHKSIIMRFFKGDSNNYKEDIRKIEHNLILKEEDVIVHTVNSQIGGKLNMSDKKI